MKVQRNLVLEWRRPGTKNHLPNGGWFFHLGPSLTELQPRPEVYLWKVLRGGYVEDARMSSIQIGRYKVSEALGQGGMGVVYLAQDPMLERPVAIKVIHPRRLTVEAKDRFFREARAVARLDSPYIVKIYDIGVQPDGDKELHYIVMEFVAGETLSSLTEGQGVPTEAGLSKRLQLFWQLLQAMRYAHEHGVVHRDIKPDNVMISSEGRVKIMDFGLAVLDDRHSKTRDDQIMGTLSYFAPEQAKGGKGVDHRADIYALGVVLFELVTGSLPFIATNPLEMIHKVLTEPPPSIEEKNPQAPWALEKIVVRSLRKEPLERYQSIAEMLLDLEQLLQENFQVSARKLDPHAAPSFVPPKEPAAPRSEPPPARPETPRWSSTLGPPMPSPEVPTGNFGGGSSRISSPQFPLPIPIVKLPPPPSLEATRVEIFERASGATKSPAPAKSEEAHEAPPPARSVPYVPYLTAQGQPQVASAGWMNEASHPAPPAAEQARVKMRKDEEVQQKLTVPEEASTSARQTCGSCGASVPSDFRHCPECNAKVTASYYRISREALEFIEQAKLALFEGRFEEAQSAAEKAVDHDDKLGEGHLCLGRAELGLGMLAEAEGSLEQAAELLPNSAEPYLILAEVYLARNDIEGIVASLLEALERSPGDHEVRCRLGFLYSETGRNQNAIEQYRIVLRNQPKHLQANRQMGLLLARTERHDEAIRFLEKANEIDPNDGQSSLLLGRLYARRRQFGPAQEAFQKVLALKGEDASLRSELGALYQAQNKEELAVKELKRALELDHGNREARIRLAALFEKHGRLDQAVKELEEALRHHPEDLPVHRRLGEIYLQQRELSKALAHFETVVRLDPKCAEMHNQLGRIYLKKSYTDKSIEHYRQAVELHKVEPEYREDLAMAHYCKGDYPSAIRELQKASMLDGRNPDYSKGLGMLYFAMGEDEEAVRQLQWSLQLRSQDPQAHGMLGQAYGRQGLTNMAITEYARALELDPNMHILQLSLARALAAAGRHSEAIASFKTFASRIGASEEIPMLGQAYLDMGNSYLADGQYARAREVFQMALKSNPKDAGALHGLAKVAMAKRELPVAKARLREAVALEPRNPKLIDSMAELQGMEGNWSAAAATLQRAIVENPAVADLHEQLGRSLRKAGKHSEAIAAFRRGAEAFPARAWRFYWLEGRVEFRRERYGEATSLYRRALERVPQNYLILQDLAEACQRLGELKEAVSLIDKALEFAPSKDATNLRRLKVLYETELAQKSKRA